MKLSTKGRYAVMAMTDLAAKSDKKPMPLAEIAKRQEISLSYLEQLFGKLRRNNLVTSTRGPGGGYMLAHSLDETMISDIVMAVDEPLKATRCAPGTLTGCQSDNTRCVTHDLWEELSNHIFLFLRSISLADVVERRILGRSAISADEGDGARNLSQNGSVPNQPAREVGAPPSKCGPIERVA